MSNPANSAAWLPEAKANPLKISEAPYTAPAAGEVLVKNAAWAINPVDNKIQDMNLMELPTPLILGLEVTGEIAAVGEGVQGFKIGQRVMGVPLGTTQRSPSHAGFQTYTLLSSQLVTPIPSSLSFTDAAALPVGLSTAAAALFNPTHFALPIPSSPSPPSSATGNGTLILWGASSAVGLSTLQLARLAGIEVVAVAGAQNHALVKSLGAAEVYDHKHPRVVDQVLAAVAFKKVLGVFDAISMPATTQSSCDILARLEGDDVTRVVVTTVPSFAPLDAKGVEVRLVFGASVLGTGVAGKMFGADGLATKALDQGTIVAKPDVKVVGKGLEDIQKGLDVCRAGYSATKIVIEA